MTILRLQDRRPLPKGHTSPIIKGPPQRQFSLAFPSEWCNSGWFVGGLPAQKAEQGCLLKSANAAAEPPYSKSAEVAFGGCWDLPARLYWVV